MRPNPVYKMEKMTSSRSMSLSLIVFCVNLVLTVAAFVIFSSIMYEAEITGEVPYQSFVDLYQLIACFEFIMVSFIVPVLTSGAIAGERERQTFELLLSTRMSCPDIIIGKLLASLRTVLIVILSAFPVLSLVFVYGGVSLTDMVVLFLYYVLSAFFSGSLGLIFSTVFRRTSFATVASYVSLIMLHVGTIGAVYLNYRLSYIRLLETFHSVSDFQAGKFIYLLLLNPSVSFYSFLNMQVGSGWEFSDFLANFGIFGSNMIIEYWPLISMSLQVGLAAVFIGISIWRINPLHNGSNRLTWKE